jgi:hypothetical protein
MPHLWDYDEKVLKKSKKGRLLLLERMINYGVYPNSKERIDISEIKKYWDKLQIDRDRKRFLHYLIWGN